VTLYIGTSGWAYPEWKPGFYPAEVPRSRFLAYYASKLSACEINATFYKAQERDVVARWVEQASDGFLFALKAHRALTHAKSIAPEGIRAERLATFLETASWFGKHRGPLLFQLPAYRKLDLEALSALLGRIPGGMPFAFEFRDASWNRADVVDAIVAAGGTICHSDTTGRVPDTFPPGPFAYVRMRAERYPTKKRAAWRKLLEREAGDRDVYVFTKHEGIPAGDPFGGIGLAVWLRRYAPTLMRAPGKSTSNHTVVT
jgi:uncharacterized protein YecE (DUF72 family)